MNNLNPAALSKINWTQAIAFVAMLATVFGFDIPPEQQVAYVAMITTVQSAVTIIWRTFFTAKP